MSAARVEAKFPLFASTDLQFCRAVWKRLMTLSIKS
jgi:hypothetical protein